MAAHRLNGAGVGALASLLWIVSCHVGGAPLDCSPDGSVSVAATAHEATSAETLGCMGADGRWRCTGLYKKGCAP
jgi:hypothetical protein